MPLGPEIVTETRRTLDDLTGIRLGPQGWARVESDLDALADAVARADDPAVREALVPLSGAVFEGKVRRRMDRAGRSSPLVAPTKQTSALPAVGAVCAAVLLVLGYVIGGGLVLAVTAVLSLFVLGVALAGSRTARERDAARRARLTRTEPDATSAPGPVRSRASAILDVL